MATKITITGGSGFIGTRLCQDLFDRHVNFEIIDLKPSLRFPERTKIADIRDINALRNSITGNIIVHLAAVHRDDVRDKSLYATTNVDGTRNLCTVAEDRKISKIIFTSTVAVYGFAAPGTGEDGAINPFNEYGRTKFAAERALSDWKHRGTTERTLVIVRPTVVFGEGNRGNVYNLLSQIASGRFVMVGPGTNRKSMAYVGNVSAFLRQATAASQSGLNNYVDTPDYDMNTLVSEVSKDLGINTKIGLSIPYGLGILFGSVADIYAYFSKSSLPISRIRVKKFCATTEFTSCKSGLENFSPPFTLKEGLARTLQSEFVSPDPSRAVFFTE